MERMITVMVSGPFNGTQLRREIQAATGLHLTEEDLTAYDDGRLLINAPDNAADAIRAVVAAHTPQTRKTLDDLVRARIGAIAGISAKDLTASQVRDVLLGIAYRLGALDAQGRVLSYDDWGKE